MSSEEEIPSSPARRESSPIYHDQRSSPRDPSSPVGPASSPWESDDATTDDEYRPPRKKFSEAGVPRLQMFWPQDNAQHNNDEPLQERSGGNQSTNNSEAGDGHDSSSDSSTTTSSSEKEAGSDTSSESEDSSNSEVSDEESSTSPSSSESESESSSESESDDDTPVWAGSELTVNEGVLNIMEIFVNQKLEKKTLEAFLNCLLKFLPESHNMPKTTYLLLKYVTDLCPLPKEVIHFYCSKCHKYLGNEAKVCDFCGCEISHRFFQLSLEHQLRNLFETRNLADHLVEYSVEREGRTKDGVYWDICDGSEYKRLHIPGQFNVTLIGHTDGVSISKSSNVSLWPLEYAIVELSPNLRFKFLLVNGVWLDESKPNFNLLFRPFADEIKNLHDNGFTWTHPKTGVLHTSRVTLACFVADGPVRAQIQNIKSIGGRHSCNTCEQKMLKLPREPVLPGQKKRKRKRIFAFSEIPCKIRSKNRMEAQGEATLRHKVAANGGEFVAVKGVLGPSIVSKLSNFDRSTGVFAEYMHLVLGIVKQFLELWFESPATLPYSLVKHRDSINKLLLSIRVPDYITRIPRSTDKFSKWKANELRSFLLYYSVIVLAPYMQEVYLNHWILFVSSMQILLSDKITDSDVTKAETMLRLFIRNFAALYKSESLTYNLHNLLHLGVTVRRWGNLQYISAFQFESFNGDLVKCIHGSKNQGKELTINVRIMCGIGVLKANIERANANNILRVKLLSQIHRHCTTDVERQLLDKVGKSAESFHYRAKLNRDVYTSALYNRQRKRNNFTICFNCDSGQKKFGIVKYFVKCKNGECMAFVCPFVVDHMRYFENKETAVVLSHIIPICETEDLLLVNVNKIVSKVIRVGEYVCLRPNRYEVNL